jgi:NAD(P)-dependent dehydrogenase (short-subunit alcohol dehydrogenase family)
VREAADTVNHRLGLTRAVPLTCDVSDSGCIDAMAAQVREQHGDVDLLANNAGYAVPERVTDITDQGWDDVMAVNARGAMGMTRAFLPAVLARNFGDCAPGSSTWASRTRRPRTGSRSRRSRPSSSAR